MSIFKSVLLSLLALFHIACSEQAELLKNNNPGNYTLAKDVVWASPDGFDLTMDIYTPNGGKDNYPVLLIFHGGGWLINDNSIMDQMSAYIASNSNYVVANVNYRLLVDIDNTVKINQIVEDVFGAVAWARHNIEQYQGDSNKLAVTGDSAGGHLSAMVVNMGHQLSSQPYSETSIGFKPSYLPPGKTAEQVASENGLAVQAAVLSYGAFDVYTSSRDGIESIRNPFWLMAGSLARGIFGDDYNADDNPNMYRGVSPLYHIPSAEERQLPPQLLTVGDQDSLVSPQSVKDYLAQLRAAGHSAEYWEYPGRGHAYLDSGSNLLLGNSFEQDAPQALDVIITFLDAVFYP